MFLGSLLDFLFYLLCLRRKLIAKTVPNSDQNPANALGSHLGALWGALGAANASRWNKDEFGLSGPPFWVSF